MTSRVEHPYTESPLVLPPRRTSPMKRDLDLCRRILSEVEANTEANGWLPVAINIDGFIEGEIIYHIMLLRDAGLVESPYEDFRPQIARYIAYRFFKRIFTSPMCG